ncbi:hypothetical protein VTP01DRAFT_5940 [Rhizomucor pusillus]|uniref:uncharacterized protein n=1 Tax=Rhizomucor pusillus TaxID=4840 RepID=UPI0037445C16
MSTVTATYKSTDASKEFQVPVEDSKSGNGVDSLTSSIVKIQKEINVYLTERMAASNDATTLAADEEEEEEEEEDDAEEEDQEAKTGSATTEI